MLALEHIKHGDVNFSKWNDAVLRSEVPTVFAQSYFLNATSPGWDGLIINDYESIFPLTWKRKFGILYLPQPYFTGQLGAFGTIDHIRAKYKLIEIELNAANHLSSSFTSPKNTFVIEYGKGFSFNQNTKRNIAKALTAGLHVEQALPEEIIPLSENFLNPFLLKELKLPDLEVSRFRNLLLNCIGSGSLYTFKTLNAENTVKALGHFVYNSRYVVFLKGTNTDKLENSGSMHLLVSHAIEFFKDKCECFDFGGGSLNEGLAGFYKGLGGLQRDYHFLRINNLPRLLKVFKK